MMKRVVVLLAMSLLSGFVSALAWSDGLAITNARIFTGATPEWAEAAKIDDGTFTYVGSLCSPFLRADANR